MYDNNLIPEETLYWRDGMEQLEPVSDLCGASKRDRQRRMRRLRITGAVLVMAVALATAWCAPMLKDGWREMNDADQTQEGAYWRARGFVREAEKARDVSVAFEPYMAATVTITGTAATVLLPSTLFDKDGSGTKRTWKVTIQYDADRKEWRLPAVK
jgi:hypothetical protein